MDITEKERIFEKYKLDSKKMPAHIAIIMDGNGRWAKKRLLPRSAGHHAGRKALKKTLKNCTLLGIKYLSVYAFSTENWKRPKEEVSLLMKLLKSAIEEELKELKQEKVKLKFLGGIEKLDPQIIKKIERAESETKDNSRIQLNIMLNYGARYEILNAVKKLLKSSIKAEELTESSFSNLLFTKDIPDPDILIRTGGDYRVSNFLLWQIAYTELFISDKFWPDFNLDDIAGIIAAFQHRDRRFGALNINKER